MIVIMSIARTGMAVKKQWVVGADCFFDDPVHELLGLETGQFQSLYHSTAGHPVEDRRLTTLPAYSSNSGGSLPSGHPDRRCTSSWRKGISTP